MKCFLDFLRRRQRLCRFVEVNHNGVEIDQREHEFAQGDTLVEIWLGSMTVTITATSLLAHAFDVSQ